ncbi:hypothetical protein [Actinoplanes sp. RD1]|uniref:hypothetical protein n=1 Tax=Actinoplanes sp. RD1 TaxID=3064538 RepID=UPI002740F756|nr:hypothetical protein [Actinoplanes sp. RD1]
MRTARSIAVAATLGAVLAAAAAVANHLPVAMGEVGLARADRSPAAQAAEYVNLLLDSAPAWIVLGAGAGWLAARCGLAVAALAGAIATVTASLVYDSLEAVLAGGFHAGDVRPAWLALSLVVGPVTGILGALARRPGPAGLLAGLAALAAAAAARVALPAPAESPVAGPATATLWAAVAAGAVALVLRARPAARQ